MIRAAACLTAVLLGASLHAQDAIVISGTLERFPDGNGGGFSAAWVHPAPERTLIAGATSLSAPGIRWTYATAGAVTVRGRSTFNAEANGGYGTDDSGGFPFVLLRAGVARAVTPRVSAELEALYAEAARATDGVIRAGLTAAPMPRLTLRASAFGSVTGDRPTRLATARADYDVASMTAIGGVTTGEGAAAILQRAGSGNTKIREIFGGLVFGAASRRWTVVGARSSVGGEARHRLAVSLRLDAPRWDRAQ